ncbi:hypothetical protein ACRALDRAFT_2020953 [Sodiomyces alcalophilus JCM 7366]|uniref:uncharacterized protein n=1 Tax=Sodiomyces alcalophilus JCM 7366 TaxID=591952 RepID=UPI0039B498D1
MAQRYAGLDGTSRVGFPRRSSGLPPDTQVRVLRDNDGMERGGTVKRRTATSALGASLFTAEGRVVRGREASRATWISFIDADAEQTVVMDHHHYVSGPSAMGRGRLMRASESEIDLVMFKFTLHVAVRRPYFPHPTQAR